MKNHNLHKVQQTMKTHTHALSDEQVGPLPTEEDVAVYEEHGWYISKKVIPDEAIAG